MGKLTDDALPWARYHPHFRGDRGENNTLYIATENLSLNGESLDINGAGLFPQINERLVLTAPGSNGCSLWRLPSAFYPEAGKPPLSHHGDLTRWQRDGEDYCTLKSVRRGQEFILDTTHYPGVFDWVKTLLTV